ncbi:MAG: site-2 protease family protein [Synergistales bacterium]|nr:site-2 protease family protein [Synergistales bacterium]MDY6400867.1 site-2 protease family protein [Synergistales bacterium]MDY6404860.1 site-2 protease family protein [Synergistales bacterium]MDY6410748.1 site-2 protease family protein [Synergistales bacterium]MDY6414660.1 site-2 protease family protein [Synergistales bacterium]
MMRILHDPIRLLLTIPALLWALSFHEFCHGFAAKMAGDPTAERSGRLSLNPFAHFDLIGTLMLLFVGFGWAKPVPINVRYFKHPRRDLIIVSLAGVAGNILTAVLTVLFFRFFGDYWFKIAGRAGLIFLIQMVNINMGLAAFNLIPIPPLDGSRVLEAFLPYKYLHYYYWLEHYGMIILLVLLMTGIINFIFDPIINILWALLPY